MFFKALGLKCNLQEKTLHNVYASLGVYQLSDILSLTLDQLVQVDKMGEKKANGILGALYEALSWTEVSSSLENGDKMEYLLKLCAGLQCFERGFAGKKIKLYVDYLCFLDGHEKVLDFARFYDNVYIEGKTQLIIDSLDAYAPKQITLETMRLFLIGFKQMNIKMTSLNERSSIPFVMVTMTQLLDGLGAGSGSSKGTGVGGTFVFSGFRNAQWEKIITQHGGTITSQVTKQTTALVVKDRSKTTSKTKKAHADQVAVYNEKEFIEFWGKEYKDIPLC